MFSLYIRGTGTWLRPSVGGDPAGRPMTSFATEKVCASGEVEKENPLQIRRTGESVETRADGEKKKNTLGIIGHESRQ
jgi:hypothetical protein